MSDEPTTETLTAPNPTDQIETTSEPSTSTITVGRFIAGIVIAALLGGIIGGLVTRGTTTTKSVTKVISGGPVKQVATTSNIKSVLKKVEPAVVSVVTSTVSQGQEGAGTGMILTSDGEVLTNAHVVTGGNSFSVTLYNSTKQLPADLVGIDPTNDVALLRIRNDNNTKYDTVELGNSDAIAVGDPVVAIGNALALAGTPSVTTGIISAKNRSIDSQEEQLQNLLQTDAAINFGNSGGPLVDLNGKVVGINTATADPSQTQNIGFAIPINTVKPLLSDLKKGKNNNEQALLGVTTVTLTADLKLRFSSISVDSGAVVDEVQGSSPASDINLQTLDVIVKVDSTDIKSSEQLVAAIRKHKPGDKVTITWYRGDKKMSEKATLVSRAVGESQQLP